MAEPERRDSAIVAALSSGSGKRGCAVVSSDDYSGGDFVSVRHNENEIVTRVLIRFGGSHEENLIRLDEWQRDNLGVAEGQTVTIRKIPPGEIQAATGLELGTASAVPRGEPIAALADFIRRERFPLYMGFRFEFGSLGSDQPIVCEVRRIEVERKEVSFAVCGDATVVRASVSVAREVGFDDVSYDDIGGLDQDIQIVRESIELPIRMRNSIKSLGVSIPRGIIFYGPPGTGKTMLAKAVACKAQAPIFTISPAELLSLGPKGSESRLNEIFDQAESEQGGSIVIIDEIDAIASKRSESSHGSGGSLVTGLLARLDGLKTTGNVVVIATTNRIDSIDEALRRHGRFSREIHVAAPNEAGRQQILRIHTRGMSLAEESEDERDAMICELGRTTHGFVGADLMELCRESGLTALRRAHPLDALDRGDFTPQAPLAVTREDFLTATKVIQPSALKEVMVSIPDVSFSDIKSLDEIVEEIKDRVMGPMQHPEVFSEMGLEAERGLLLYGPPGTGKTMLAKAIAKEAGANFILVQGPELLSKWVGESERGIRTVFARARQLAPSIVFFDEIEAVLPIRGNRQGDTGVTDRVVNQFLTEVDGVVDLKDVTIIGATNRYEMIDQAALRPGRLGLHIYVPFPESTGRMELFRHYAGPDHSEDCLRELAETTQGFSGADIAAVCRNAKLIAVKQVNFQQSIAVTLDHLKQSLEQLHQRRKRKKEF